MSNPDDATRAQVSTQTRLNIYRTMRTIEQCNLRIQDWLNAGKLAFQYYPCWGQEAIPAALTESMEQDDFMVTTYRCIHDVVAKGSPIKEVFAEIAGRSTGLCKGKGGPMHLSDPNNGLMVTTGIVGGGAPIANGLALAKQLQGQQRVVACSFGDGAMNIGAVHEALNLAALWKLPVVFVCQNNAYAEHTTLADSTASPSLAARAGSYGMRAVDVDGTDADAMYRVGREAVEHARSGAGPFFIEAKALRLQGHSYGGEETYMAAAELKAGRDNNPVKKLRDLLLAGGVSESDLGDVEKAIDDVITEAEQFADNSPVPCDEELFLDVFASTDHLPDRNAATPASERPAGETETLTFCQAINQTLGDLMEQDDSVILMGEDIHDPAGGVGKATLGLSTRFGLERVRPTPISEQAIVGAGTGAAMAGLKPVIEVMIGDFFAVCMDQVTNHAAKLRYMSGGRTNVPLTIRSMDAGNVGSFGAQHSQSLEAWFTHSPGMKVVVPSTPADLKGLLTTCIYDEDPCIVFECMRLYFKKGEVPTGDYRIPLGVANVRKPGSDVTIITYGWTVELALAAAAELEKQGIQAEVLDLRSLVPLDQAAIFASVEKTKRALVLHSGVTFNGFGSEIASRIHENLHDTLLKPVRRVGAEYTPAPFANNLEQQYFPNESKLIAAVLDLVE